MHWCIVLLKKNSLSLHGVVEFVNHMLHTYMCKLCCDMCWWRHAHLLWQLNQQFLWNVTNLAQISSSFMCKFFVSGTNISGNICLNLVTLLMDQYLAYTSYRKHMIIQQHFHCNWGLHKHSHTNTLETGFGQLGKSSRFHAIK